MRDFNAPKNVAMENTLDMKIGDVDGEITYRIFSSVMFKNQRVHGFTARICNHGRLVQEITEQEQTHAGDNACYLGVCGNSNQNTCR